MSTDDNNSIIGDISEAGTEADSEEELQTRRSPPSKGNLERETNKLRSKYKILRDALIDERLGELDEKIQKAKSDSNPSVAEELYKLEQKKIGKLMTTHKKRRVVVESILNEYKAKAQGLKDEHKAIEVELKRTTPSVVINKKRKKKIGKNSKNKDNAIDLDTAEPSEKGLRDDLKTIKPKRPLENSESEYDNLALVHSE